MADTPRDHEGHVGDSISASNAAWSFSGEVAKQFPDHVRRSIPLYEKGHQLVCDISDFFLPSPAARCYELGCSNGDLMARLVNHHDQRQDIEWLAVDHQSDMIDVAVERHRDLGDRVQWLCDDICTMSYASADLVVAYYTVQFVTPRLRQDLIDRVFESLNWGGALLMFEKVRGPDARFQDMFTHLYTEFKLQNGYEPEEIVHKSRSLKGVLEPFSSQANVDMLKRAGFRDITTVMQYLCFQGFLAIK